MFVIKTVFFELLYNFVIAFLFTNFLLKNSFCFFKYSQIIFINYILYPPNIGFLRRNKRKDKKKKSSGKDEDGGESLKDIGSDGEDVHKSGTPTPEVDEEGLFTFLSKKVQKIREITFHKQILQKSAI